MFKTGQRLTKALKPLQQFQKQQPSMFAKAAFGAASSLPKNFEIPNTFQAKDTELNQVDVRKIKPMSEDELVFGRVFTDHMLSIDWTKEGGWDTPKIVPYGPISMETSATALHYGISVHDGISIVENGKTGKM